MPYTAPKVDANAFTMYDGPYAQALAGASQQAGPRGYLSMAALGNKVGGGQENYLRAMEAANANQLAGSEAENETNRGVAYYNNAANFADKGIISMIGAPRSIATNQAGYEQSDLIRQDGFYASGQKARAEVLEKIGPLGYLPPKDQLGSFIQGPVPAREGYNLRFDDYETPENYIARKLAENDARKAEAAMVAARRPPSSNGDETSWTETGTDSRGIPIVIRRKGTPPAIRPSPLAGETEAPAGYSWQKVR
jgi:hypothetical protein